MPIKTSNLILTATALLSLGAPIARAEFLPNPAADDKSSYAAGTRAMNDQRWQDAVSSFDQVVNAHGRQVDAALYWKAYSLNKMGNKGLALATCFQLRQQYTSSTWNKDCDALRIDLNVPPVAAVAPVPPVPPVAPVDGDFGPYRESARSYSSSRGGDPDSDLKILALNSLLHQDPARAIPMLRGILTGNQPDNVKKHAIFVLAQSKSPEAQSILNEAVTGKMNPDLQRQAIEMMAVFEGKRANDSLAKVYSTTSDRRIKRSIINAFFISQDAPRMVDLARNEKDLDLKRTIVQQLALMNDKAATDYMLELLK